MGRNIQNFNKNVFYIINKLNAGEYISNNSFLGRKLFMEEELTDISNEDENMVIKYLLDIMKEHGIITDEEYIKVLYRYCQGV